MNNFHKIKYEDIKNTSNKDENPKIIQNINSNIFLEQKNYINIKQKLLRTNNTDDSNKKNDIPKLIHKHKIKSTHFNKTSKNDNITNKLGFNKKNIYLKYYNNNNHDMNLLSERTKEDNIFLANEENIIENNFKRDLCEENSVSKESIKSDEDDEPDPRINFEHINKVNKARPLTSYGGINARRKNLQSALLKNQLRPGTAKKNFY